MARTFERVRDDAMELSVEERGWLADAIWESLLTDEEREIQNEWIADAERRLKGVEDGTAKLIPYEDVKRELRAKYPAQRRPPQA